MGFTIHKPKWRGVLVFVLVAGLLLGGFFAVKSLRHKDLKVPEKQPQSAAEASMKFPVVSSPSKEYNATLLKFAESTTNVKEKYLAYVRLCYSYKSLDDYSSAKSYCEKAVAIAGEAKIDQETQNEVLRNLGFINARLTDSKQTNPQGSDDAFKEPAN